MDPLFAPFSFPQLWHMGAMREDGTGPVPDAPSCRPSGLWGPAGRYNTVPKDYEARMVVQTQAMTQEWIADVIAGFARSAAAAVELGFDGIAVHGAHG